MLFRGKPALPLRSTRGLPSRPNPNETVDRTFVNDMQMENIRIVADFLDKHPEVNLIIRGYSGASHKEESPTMHLAEKRVASVKKALVKYYNVDPSRLETSFDEEAESPYRLTADWIDAVVFEMKERAGQ